MQAAALSLKLAEGDIAGLFEGLAATFGPLPDRQGDVILPGAFDAWLTDAHALPMPLLWQHDQQAPVGSILTANAAREGLRIAGRIVTTTDAGAEAYALAQVGALSFSIGYVVPPGGSRYDDRTGVRYLSAVEVREVSLVSVPANAGARIESLKSAYEASTIRVYERFAREALGLSSRDATKVASKTWSIVSRRDGSDEPRDGETTNAALAILQRSKPSP